MWKQRGSSRKQGGSKGNLASKVIHAALKRGFLCIMCLVMVCATTVSDNGGNLVSVTTQATTVNSCATAVYDGGMQGYGTVKGMNESQNCMPNNASSMATTVKDVIGGHSGADDTAEEECLTDGMGNRRRGEDGMTIDV